MCNCCSEKELIMKEFELWLDESGSFSEDNLIIKNEKMPSFVGGVLYDKETSLEDILAISPPQQFHSTEADPRESYRVFTDLEKKDIRFIMFCNKEKLLVINDKLTYLNVIAEGIIQIISKLKSAYGTAHLDVLVATRKDIPKSTEIARKKGTNPKDEYVRIQKNEYFDHLKERIIVEGKKYQVFEEDCTIRFDSARRNSKLILADVVCNLLLTKNSMKIKRNVGPDASLHLNEVMGDHNKTWQFSLLESPARKLFHQFMLEGRVAEAIVTLCEAEDESLLKEGKRELLDRLPYLSIHNMDLQKKMLVSFMLHKLKTEWNLNSLLRFYQKIEADIIPIIRDSGIRKANEIAEYLMFEVKFDQFTVYTHMGNTKQAEECEDECKKRLIALPKDWDYIAYSARLENRTVINMINEFALKEAMKKCNNLVKQTAEIKEALLMTYTGDEDEFCFEEYAKALGTRAQINMFQLRSRRSLYDSAKADSDAAIAEFSALQDKLIQYSFRVQIETEADHEEEALKYLGLMCGIEYKSYKDLEQIANYAFNHSRFDMMSYIRLMGEGSVRGFSSAAKMYQIIERGQFLSKIDLEYDRHPDEIINWKLGTYYANSGSLKAAQRAYERAVDICFNAYDNVTLMCIGLAIEMEMYDLFQKKGQNNASSIFKLLRNNTERLNAIAPDVLNNCFGNDFYQIVKSDITASKQDWFEKSRLVTY